MPPHGEKEAEEKRGKMKGEGGIRWEFKLLPYRVGPVNCLASPAAAAKVRSVPEVRWVELRCRRSVVIGRCWW